MGAACQLREIGKLCSSGRCRQTEVDHNSGYSVRIVKGVLARCAIDEATDRATEELEPVSTRSTEEILNIGEYQPVECACILPGNLPDIVRVGGNQGVGSRSSGERLEPAKAEAIQIAGIGSAYGPGIVRVSTNKGVCARATSQILEPAEAKAIQIAGIGPAYGPGIVRVSTNEGVRAGSTHQDFNL